MACLDIGTAGTFSGNRSSPAIEWDVAADAQSYKNVSRDYLESRADNVNDLFGVQCDESGESEYYGDGVINSFDIGVLVFALFGVAPYDALRGGSGFGSVLTVAQRPETQSRCLTEENRTAWQLQLHQNQYCPAAPADESRRLSMLDAENADSYQVAHRSRRSRSLHSRGGSRGDHAVGEGFIRTRFTGHNALGSWHGFEFAPNIVPVMLELMLHGVWSVGSAPLSNAPPPTDSDEVPFWPDRHQLRWSRSVEQKRFARDGTVCNDIVSGATGTQTLIGDTLSVRQEGRGSNCPFWLYLWVPATEEYGGGQLALPGRSLRSHDQGGALQQVWAKAGSSAMTTTGPVMLNPSDDVEFDQTPPPPAAPPSIPAPPEQTFAALEVTHDFKIVGESSEAVMTEILAKLDDILLELTESLEVLTGATPKITVFVEPLLGHWGHNETNATDELSLDAIALLLHPRRALEHAEGCVNGSRLRASINYNARVAPDVVNQFKAEWKNAMSAINAQPCADPEFDMLPDAPSDASSQTPEIAIAVALIVSAICCCGCCVFYFFMVARRRKRKNETDSEKAPLRPNGSTTTIRVKGAAANGEASAEEWALTLHSFEPFTNLA